MIGEGGVKVDYNTAGALLSFDLLKALRDGEIVSIQGARAEGDVAQITAPLFDRETRLPNGPFVLSFVTGVPIYPLFITRSGCRSYRIIVREPIQLRRENGTREEEIDKGVAQWCAVLQEVVADVVEVAADPRPADQLGRQGRGGAVGQLISLDSSSRVTMPS